MEWTGLDWSGVDLSGVEWTPVHINICTWLYFVKSPLESSGVHMDSGGDSKVLVYGINCVSISPTMQNLWDHFSATPIFRDVIDALEGIQSESGLRAQHRVAQYMIDKGKLWFVGGGTWAWAVARRECVTKEEAVELARKEHEKRGALSLQSN